MRRSYDTSEAAFYGFYMVALCLFFFCFFFAHYTANYFYRGVKCLIVRIYGYLGKNGAYRLVDATFDQFSADAVL